MELAIDTSTEVAGIALSERGVLVEERIWNAGRNHTVELMPRVAALLEDHGAAASALDAVFVATGPGGFTAVRVGISAAKGLALASGATLVGVGTMWIEASPFAGRGLPIRPIMDAGRGELIVGRFVPTDEGLAEASPPALLTVEALIEESRETSLFCGQNLSTARERLAEALGDLARFPGPAEGWRRPSSLCALGWERLQRGEATGDASAAPIYARPPAISTPNPAKAVRRDPRPRKTPPPHTD